MHTDLGITRDEALKLMKDYLTADNLQKHSRATEVIMRKLARMKGEDEELWGITGLLHDLDFEETKDHMAQHTLKDSRSAEGKRCVGRDHRSHKRP